MRQDHQSTKINDIQMAAELNRSSIPFHDYHQLPSKGITQSCEYINPWKPNSGKMPRSSETTISSSRPKLDQYLCEDHYDLHAAALYEGCSSSNESFENNQSFPKISCTKAHLLQAAGQNHAASAGAVDAPFSVDTDFPGKHSAKTNTVQSLQLPPPKIESNCYKFLKPKELLDPLQTSFNDSSSNLSCTDVSSSKCVDVPYPGDCSLLPSNIRNPNKAVFTIDAKTSKILTANEMACALFDYNRSDMICRCLTDLIQLKKKDQQTIMESYLQPSGQVISIAGKVVEAIDKNGLVLPVSLWMKRVDYNKKSRCLVAMEPIHRLISSVYFNQKGEIIRCDEKLSCFFGYTNNEDIIGSNITQLIPAFKLPKPSQRLTKNFKKQRATGKTLDGSIFPLTIHVHAIEIDSDDDSSLHPDCYYPKEKPAARVFEGVVCFFSTITGLITFFPDGTIHSINHHFALMLFGYSSAELIGKTISTLIPEFYSIVSSVPVADRSTNHCNTSQLKYSASEVSTFTNAIKKKGSKKGTLEGNIAHHKHQEMLKGINDKNELNFSKWMKDVEKMEPDSSSTPYRSSSSSSKLNDISQPLIEKEDPLFLPAGQIKIMQCDSIASEDGFLSITEESSSIVQESDALQEDDLEKEDAVIPRPALMIATHLPSAVEQQDGEVDDGDMTPTVKTLENSKSASIESDKMPVELECDGDGDGGDDDVELQEENILQSENTSCPKQNCDDDHHHGNADTDDDKKLSLAAIVRKTDGRVPCETNLCPRTQSVSSELMFIDSKMKALQVDCDLPSEFGSDNYLDCESQSEDLTTTSMVNITDRKKSPSKKRFSNKRGSNANLLNRMTVSLTETVPTQTPLSNSAALRRRKSLKSLPQRKTYFEKSKSVKMLASSEDSEDSDDDDADSFELLEKEIQKACLGKEYDEDLLDSGDILCSGCSPKKTKDIAPKSLASLAIDSSKVGKSQHLPSLDSDEALIPVSILRVTEISKADPELEPVPPTLGKMTSTNPQLSYHKAAVRNSHVQKKKSRNEVNEIVEDNELIQENLSSLDEFTDGEFTGLCVHKDGSYIGINFAINPMLLESGELMFCMWVSQDLESASVAGFCAGFTSCSNDESIHSEDMSCSSHGGTGVGIKYNGDYEESYPKCKPYDRDYQNLRTIGHGAFGFVVESLDLTAKCEVIVKYILRSKVLAENWRDDEEHGRIPLEVSMLTQLSHQNIVQVLDVFDCKDYILMVMEKHGSGMDLFEFIEHKPHLDEPLHSYIFRQIVSAVGYLHRSGIVHRDLKDENIIVNEEFHIKLIDFGSAANIEPEKMFATFCGTVEYCSPEVLMGNWYEGPELEVWSMGVTLYTLVYGENPFFTVDDILECNFNPPYEVSEYLTDLLYWMLLPDPADRMTIKELEQDTWVFQPIVIENYSWTQVMYHEPSMTTSDYNVNYEPVSYADIFSLSCAPRISSVRPFTRPSNRPHYLSY